MGNTIQKDDAIQVVQTFSSSISIISCLVMSYKISKERKVNIANRMLAYLLFIDFVLAVFYGIGRAGAQNAGFCQIQGVMLQWFEIVAMCWVVLMSYQMHQWIVKKKNTKKIEKAINRSMGVIFAASWILSIILLGLGLYDFAYLWCWIDERFKLVRFFCFDLILIITWIITIYVLREVSVSLTARLNTSSIDARIGDLFSSSTKIQRKLVMYATLFVVIWSTLLLNRLTEMGLGHEVFPLALLQAIVLPLQGFFNALCYGGYLDELRFPWDAIKEKVALVIPHHRHSISDNKHLVNREVVVSNERLRSGSDKTTKHVKGFVPKVYSIFVSTFNMGEAPTQSLQADLKEWVLEGHDIYAIGLQECVDLPGVRSVILDHLGGPSKYAIFTTEIGSGNTRLGYHGYIALTVYVRVSELREGFIHPTKPASETMATGTDLLITTAQNKGAVGLPFQIHDTNIGFVTCHLPSDSKGASKLSKRNASAHSILKEVTLAPEDLGFDLHLQHDHMLVFGDLNYRMETREAGVNSLTGVAVASLIERNTMGDDPNWVARRYNLLRSLGDPLHPSLDEIRILKNAKVNSKGAWSSVLRADELRSIMDDGDAFCGFEEPMPCFAPSYKRRKGLVEGDCGDYTDPTKIISGFSNTGDIESELAFQRTAQATPPSPHHKGIQPVSFFADISGDSERRTDISADVESSRETLGGLERESEGSGGRQQAKRRAAGILASTPDVVVVPKKPVDPRKLRPPSYTDRILIHSLPDRVDRLTVQAYDLCDMIRISDHRPVSMTIKLQVNGAVSYKTPSTIVHDVRKEPKFDLFELTISNVAVHLGVDDALGGDSDEEDDEEDEEVSYRDTEESIIDELPPTMVMENPLHGANKQQIGGPPQRSASARYNRDTVSSMQGVERSSSARFASTASPQPSVEVEMMSTSSFASSSLASSLSPSHSLSSSFPPKGRPKSARFADSTDGGVTSCDFTESNYSRNDIESGPSSDEVVVPKPPKRKKSFFAFAFADEKLSENDDEDSSSSSSSNRGSEGSKQDKRKSSTNSSATSSSSAASSTVSSSPTRKKSFFMFGAGKRPTSAEMTEEDDILKEMNADAMSWKNDLHQPGEWRKRVQEEERRRKEEKALQQNNNVLAPINKLKKKKKKKSDDKLIDQFTVVFPLPSKDPLLSHRKIYDFSQAYGKVGSLEERETVVIERDTDLLSVTSEQATHVDKNTAASFAHQVTRDDLLKPMAVFAWPAPEQSANKRSSTAPLPSGKAYKVRGCASPELGAHVLLKFTNKLGYDLGTCVVCLSHLINRDAGAFYSTEFVNMQLSSGGQKRGELSGKFSLKFLPSPISAPGSIGGAGSTGEHS